MSDFDRPLKDRGREAAKQIGKHLASEKLNLPIIICSPALRTRETAYFVVEGSGLSFEGSNDDRINEASLGDLLQVVSEIFDDNHFVILIGHNPGLEELLAFLTGEGRRMPTCALAKINLDVASWKDVKAGAGILEWLITPKELPED